MDSSGGAYMNRPVIIGGGIAGLSAANYLLDNGIEPILIEAHSFSRHKVCGEFFSPEAVGLLENWNIPISYIKQAHFIARGTEFILDFPNPAGSISRALCEQLLADRAQKLGGRILTNTTVTELVPAVSESTPYHLVLSTGETMRAQTLILAAGRLPIHEVHGPLYAPRYIGIKAHFKNLPVHDQLYMYITPGAYMGVSSIEEDKTNISCLAKREMVERAGGAHMFIQNFIENIPELKERLYDARCLYDNWLICPVYSFGKKVVPQWPNAYFIGDAAASIEPAAGNGLAMAITSGIMAAQYAIDGSYDSFRKAWHKRYSRRLRWAKLLHSIFLRPTVAKQAFLCARVWPTAARIFYHKTREE